MALPLVRHAGARDAGVSLSRPRPTSLIIAAAAVGAAVWAVVGSAWVFPQLSANSDEGIYLLQADALAQGDLTVAAPVDDTAAYRPWFAVADGDRFILKYTPVHASVLALGGVMGSARIGLALVAAAQVLVIAWLARELGFGPRASAVAAVVLATTPLVLHLEITYLAYGTSLVLSMAAAAAGFRAARLGSPRWAVVAGLCWGVAFFARPYDAVLWGTATAIGLVLEHRRAVLRLLPAALGGAVGPLVLLLLFNASVTGDAFQLPFNLLEPADRLGFGLRRAVPEDPLVDFTPARGISALGRNLLLVLGWTGGGLVGAVVAARQLARHHTGRAFLVALLVIWPLGYTIFWGSYMVAFVWDGALFLGPYYYLPMVAALAVAAGAGLVELHDERPPVALGVGAAGLVLAGVILVPALAEQHDRTSQRVAVADALDAALADTPDEPALVFVPPIYGDFLQNPWSFLRNTPDVDGDRIYALSGSVARDARIAADHPDRQVVTVEVANGWSDGPGYEPELEVRVVRPAR